MRPTDGSRLFSGTLQETIVWNVESGEKLNTIAWGVDSLVLRDSGNTLIGSRYASQGAKIYSLDRAELLAELHVFTGSRGAFEDLRDWLVITPDGRFDGSPEALKRIAFRRIICVQRSGKKATLASISWEQLKDREPLHGRVVPK